MNRRPYSGRHLGDMGQKDFHREFPEADEDLLIVMRIDELSNLQWHSKLLLFRIKARRIDILVEVKEDTPLQPAAADTSRS